MSSHDVDTKMRKLPHGGKGCKVITLSNNKGGCGKTTLAIALYLFLLRMGYNCLLIDGDPQSNASQRLGIPETGYRGRRLSDLFTNAKNRKYVKSQMGIARLLHFKYLFRMTEEKVGKGIILPGEHFSGIHAKHAAELMDQSTLLNYFRDCINAYKPYVDFIIIDTAPALEGNHINELAVQVSDILLCPVDGYEAASGIHTVWRWIKKITSPTYLGSLPRPNMFFALVKLQDDMAKAEAKETADPMIRNQVFHCLKSVFGDFVCDTTVKEQVELKRITPMLGRKTNYQDLCEEILEKISNTNKPFFRVATDGNFDKLEELLEPMRKGAREGKDLTIHPVQFVGIKADRSGDVSDVAVPA